jgi:hypothetical protein
MDWPNSRRKALYIFECINLSVQDLFLSELLQDMISLARD